MTNLSVKSILNLVSKLDLIDFGVMFDKSLIFIISKLNNYLKI